MLKKRRENRGKYSRDKEWQRDNFKSKENQRKKKSAEKDHT